MKFSVLIAAYQADAFIAEALESVRQQTHADWELIVLEDGSRGQTEAIVERFAAAGPQSVRYENAGSNQGVAATRSRLLQLAAGEALAFLDADDRWLPEHLAVCRQALAAEVALTVTGLRVVDMSTGAVLQDYFPPSALWRDPVGTLFSRSVIISSTGVALTRALTQQVGAFDPTLRVGEDRDYWLRGALAGAKFTSTEKITAYYRKHAGSTMARTREVAEQTVAFYKKYQALSTVPARQRRRHLAASLIDLARLSRRTDRPLAEASLRQAWKLEPFNPQIPLHLAYTRWSAGAS